MSTPTTYRGDDRRAGEELTGAAGRTGAQRPVPLAAGVIEFMIRLSTERRRFPAALTLAALLLVGPAFTSTTTAQAREEGVPSYFCDFDWRKGTWHVKQLIRCGEDRWSVPGGASMALYVADRESNLEHDAYNSYSGASGIFQHLGSYWPGRADAFGFGGWSPFNARANIMVTLRMVHRLGSWSPWGG